jgi:hypothetical protein
MNWILFQMRIFWHDLIFFQYVLTSNRWQSPRATDYLPRNFLTSWNSLNILFRDKLAIEMAENAADILKSAAQRSAE